MYVFGKKFTQITDLSILSEAFEDDDTFDKAVEILQLAMMSLLSDDPNNTLFLRRHSFDTVFYVRSMTFDMLEFYKNISRFHE